ncbi:MAG: GNAT family N-acetyltransferase [Pseudomonadota bacterium]|nr:GNAT family N-acetyltransferase [Pseudomonadota bacterium]MEC7136425.1 GNAT family N-acetyltransferase [Pseudomonadota bacterium]
MSKFHIKKVSEIDKKRLFKFYQESFNYKKNNPDIFNWRYRPGFKNFEPLVLEVDGEICGHAGLIANDLKIKGKIKTGIWFTDFYVKEKYRSLGYGKLLTKEWMKICPIQITLCNDLSLKIFKKMDWSYNNKFLRKIKISNILNFIPVFKKSKELEMNVNNLGDLKIKDTNNQIISRMANDSEKLLSEKSLGIVRDENWFKWRVLDYPEKKNIIIFSYKDINIITEIKIKYGFKILNILYVSKPLMINYSNLFSNFAKNNKINFISFISKKKELFNINTPWSRKLNFAFFAEDSSIGHLINEFDNIQYIDSDIGFI